MNFFKSVFADETTPPDSPKSPPDTPPSLDPQSQNPQPSAAGPSWSFGGLIKTLATKSESMVETYRKDFEEFGSGLKKETAVIREVASRAVMDLPASLEVGASVAQESLETVGQAIDDIGATVSQIIIHGSDSIRSQDQDDSDSSDKQYSDGKRQSMNLKRYSRFDVQVSALQCDLNTYCTEPEDRVDYENWKLGSFSIHDKAEEIENLFSENRRIKEIYNELVPSRVDNEGFWSRYFYKLHKLKQAEEARALLVQKAISGEEEELSWDFDDEEDEKRSNSVTEGQSSGNVKEENNFDERSELENRNEKECVIESDKIEEKAVECKGDSGDSCKDSDLSVVSSQSLLPEEEDLGWDEIEDIGMNDESKGETMGANSTSRVDLRKRLSVAEEEEDLSWDIEDEDDEQPGNQ